MVLPTVLGLLISRRELTHRTGRALLLLVPSSRPGGQHPPLGAKEEADDRRLYFRLGGLSANGSLTLPCWSGIPWAQTPTRFSGLPNFHRNLPPSSPLSTIQTVMLYTAKTAGFLLPSLLPVMHSSIIYGCQLPAVHWNCPELHVGFPVLRTLVSQ